MTDMNAFADDMLLAEPSNAWFMPFNLDPRDFAAVSQGQGQGMGLGQGQGQGQGQFVGQGFGGGQEWYAQGDAVGELD